MSMLPLVAGLRIYGFERRTVQPCLVNSNGKGSCEVFSLWELHGSRVRGIECSATRQRLLGHESDKISAAENEAASAIREARTARDSAEGAANASANAKIASYKALIGAGKAITEADAFEKNIASATKRASEIEARIAPRRFSAKQEVKISNDCFQLASLYQGKRIRVVSYWLDTEGFVFAEQIVRTKTPGGVDQGGPRGRDNRLPEYGLAVSPDERYLIYDQLDDPASDLMLVENFH